MTYNPTHSHTRFSLTPVLPSFSPLSLYFITKMSEEQAQSCILVLLELK